MSDLITAEHFAGWRTIGSAEAGNLALCISAASEFVLGRLGRDDVLTTSHTEWLDGDGTKLLYTTYWPITAVTSLTVDTVSWTVRAAGAAEAYQYAQLPAHGKWLKARNNRVWTEGDGNILITYTAGLGVSADELPYDLRLVTIMVTDLLVKEKDLLGTGSRMIAMERIEQVVRSLNSYPVIEATLKRYGVR